MTLRFSNENDGIFTIGPSLLHELSEMLLPYLAPEGGYMTEYVMKKGFVPEGGYYEVPELDNADNYFFRVRTQEDAEGNLAMAKYGKIQGEIQFDVRSSATALLRFTYYLNPTPKKVLSKN